MMMKKGMKDKMGRAMAMRGDMSDKMGRAMKGVKKYARGGGIESKGKTRGKMVKMAYGGKC